MSHRLTPLTALPSLSHHPFTPNASHFCHPQSMLSQIEHCLSVAPSPCVLSLVCMYLSTSDYRTTPSLGFRALQYTFVQAVVDSSFQLSGVQSVCHAYHSSYRPRLAAALPFLCSLTLPVELLLELFCHCSCWSGSPPPQQQSTQYGSFAFDCRISLSRCDRSSRSVSVSLDFSARHVSQLRVGLGCLSRLHSLHQ